MIRRILTPLERYLAYYPELTLKGTPEHVGLAYEDVWLETEDAHQVHAWWIPGPSRSLQPSQTWVLFHGNGGNISARLDGYRAIHKRIGANILTVDYRGFGLSSGKPTEQGTYADARAAVSEAVARHGSGALVYFGISMGAAIAAKMATETPPSALILESPPSSFTDLAPVHFPWTRAIPRSVIMQFKYETHSHVAEANVPSLVVHGDSDSIVPMPYANRVFEAATGPKHLHVVEGGTHDRPDLVDEDRYYAVVTSFIEEFGTRWMNTDEANGKDDLLAAD